MASQRTTGDSNQVKEVPVTGHLPAQGSRPGSPSGSTTGLLAPFGNSHATSTSIPVSTWTSASGLHFREGSGNARKAKAAIRADVSDDSEERLLSPHSYPPSQTPDLSHRDPRDYAPISAPTLFSRHAAPLYLPQLDKYISSLPLPAFSSHSRTKADTKREKFVPLDRLASTGKSIESLETNYKAKPAWRNCNLILGGLVNAALGALVGASIPRLFLCWMRPRGLALSSRFTVYWAYSTRSKYLH
jgi:hypothetical protein